MQCNYIRVVYSFIQVQTLFCLITSIHFYISQCIEDCEQYSENCQQCMDIQNVNCGWCVTQGGYVFHVIILQLKKNLIINKTSLY